MAAGFLDLLVLQGVWLTRPITLVASKLFETPGRRVNFKTPGRDTDFKTPGRRVAFKPPGK